jgi:hypothetical protein
VPSDPTRTEIDILARWVLATAPVSVRDRADRIGDSKEL